VTARLDGKTCVVTGAAGGDRREHVTLEADVTDDAQVQAMYSHARAEHRHMLASGGGSVINTASFVAVMGAATSQISYTASKGGVLALSRELGVQFARFLVDGGLSAAYVTPESAPTTYLTHTGGPPPGCSLARRTPRSATLVGMERQGGHDGNG
jgi:hypothetical protein